MYKDNKFVIGMAGENEVFIYPKMANRHGIIAGATGTGKTVTLRTMAETFSDAGVPVFISDVKGDLASVSLTYPATFWDIFGEKGLALRTTISEMGPILLGNILNLTDVQKNVLTVVFKIADDEGLLLLDTKDLKAMLSNLAEDSSAYELSYGKMSSQSLTAIIRAIVALETEGGELFFGEPALDIADWIKTDASGKGEITILDAQKLINSPAMYSTFLLWLMTELFERLPEVGDLEKPRMVFFFDEAHLLFNNADKLLLEKIEQVVKLIRSKGVGVYFVTQNPKDIPEGVLAQLGCRIQHALRAYTPAELKGVKAAAESFRANPAFDTEAEIQNLGVGEALVSVLDEKGVPTVVEKTKIFLPDEQLGAIDDATRTQKINSSMLYLKYHDMVDRESAYELLMKKAEVAATEEAAAKAAEQEAKAQAIAEKEAAKAQAAADKEAAKQAEKAEKEALKEKEKTKNAIKKAVKSTASSTAGTIGREVGKSLGKNAGGSFGKTLGGNVGASLARGIIGTLFK